MTSTYTPPTRAERLQDRLEENARHRVILEKAIKSIGRVSPVAAAKRMELSEEKAALEKALAEAGA